MVYLISNFFQVKMMFHEKKKMVSLTQSSRKHQCFFSRQPSFFIMQHKCFVCPSDFTHSNIKMYIQESRFKKMINYSLIRVLRA